MKRSLVRCSLRTSRNAVRCGPGAIYDFRPYFCRTSPATARRCARNGKSAADRLGGLAGCDTCLRPRRSARCYGVFTDRNLGDRSDAGSNSGCNTACGRKASRQSLAILVSVVSFGSKTNRCPRNHSPQDHAKTDLSFFAGQAILGQNRGGSCNFAWLLAGGNQTLAYRYEGWREGESREPDGSADHNVQRPSSCGD